MNEARERGFYWIRHTWSQTFEPATWIPGKPWEISSGISGRWKILGLHRTMLDGEISQVSHRIVYDHSGV